MSSDTHSFLLQIYFVLASLIGLVLIVISGVNISRLVLNEVLGVKQYPNYSAPYPAFKDPGMATSTDGEMTAQQQADLVEWQKQYDEWKEQEKDYNSEDQNRRRQIAESLAMLLVGIPVFALHAPYVFRKK